MQWSRLRFVSGCSVERGVSGFGGEKGGEGWWSCLNASGKASLAG